MTNTGGTMHWLQTLDEARRRGGHAFLFTGSVGDGFPILHPVTRDPKNKKAPIDKLFSFGECVGRYAGAADDSALIWIFDPVCGFTFRDGKCEQAFREFAGLRVAAPANDPVAQAAAGAADAMPLPTDRLAALRLMAVAMGVASCTDKPTRCVAIMPYADVLAPATSAAGGGQQDALVALALLQIMTDDAFRRAGHLIVLAAPTAASVHEILRRPDGPLTTIVIGKPTEEERRMFVTRCCSNDRAGIQRRHADAVTALEGLRDRERQQLGLKMGAALSKLNDHRAQHDVVIERNRACVEARTTRDTAKVAFDRAFEKSDAEAAKERRAHETEITEIEERLRVASGALVLEQMNADVWKKFRPGDAVRIHERDPRSVEAIFQCDYIVLTTRGIAHGLHLAAPSDPATPIGDPREPTIFRWKDGAIFGEVIGRDTRQLLMPEHLAGIFRVTKERRDVEARLDGLRAALLNPKTDGAGEPRAVHNARTALAEAEQRIITTRDTVLAAWAIQERVLTEKITTLEQAHANPQSDAITAAAATLAALERERDAAQQRGHLPPPAVGADSFVRLTQGLGYRDIATLLRDPQADEATVRGRRIALLNRAYGHLLEVVEPPYGFEGLAGLDHVKRVLTMSRDAMLRGDRKAVPQGIFLMGPPGTGKTAIAIAFARECGMLLVKMRSIRSMWVGESERRIEEVCQALLDLAPNVCFRDETDQEDSGRDAYQGDSGVSNRIRQKLMEFEADERIRGRVLFVKATNRPDLVDAAMKRDGRADERIVVVTDKAEYAGLFPVYVKREGFPCVVTDFTPFTVMVRERGFSGAGVLNVCRRAYQLGNGTITAASLREAIEDARSSADRRADAKMTLEAIKAVSSYRNLPDGWERIAADACAVLDGRAPHPVPAEPDALDILARVGVDPDAQKN